MASGGDTNTESVADFGFALVLISGRNSVPGSLHNGYSTQVINYTVCIYLLSINFPNVFSGCSTLMEFCGIKSIYH